MFSIRYLAITILAFQSIVTKAQVPQVQIYDRIDGLPDLSIRDLCQDSSGFLWIATSTQGVWRFDGLSFQISPSTSRIRQVDYLTCDAAGNMWMSGDRTVECHLPDSTFSLNVQGNIQGMIWVEGASVLVTTDATVLDLEYHDGKLIAEELNGIRAESIGRTDSLVWASSNARVMQRNFRGLDDSWHEINGAPPTQVLDIYVDKDIIWYTCVDGIYRQEEGDAEQFYAKCQVLGNQPTGFLTCLEELCVTSADMGLQSISCPPSLQLPELDGINNISCSLQDDAGNVWLGSSGHGLITIREGALTEIGLTSGLNASTPSKLRADDDGIWVVGSNGWIDLIEGCEVKYSKNKPYGGNLVTDWSGTWNERSLVGTNRGLFLESGGSVQHLMVGDQPSGPVQDLMSISDSTYLATIDRHLHLVTIVGDRSEVAPIDPRTIVSIQRYGADIWAFGHEGFGQFVEGSVRWNDLDWLRHRQLSALSVGSEGNVALGTSSGEVAMWYAEDKQVVPLFRTETNPIRSLLLKDGQLFFTTPTELRAFDLSSGKTSTLWTHRLEFLPLAPVESRDGKFYFASSEGVLYLDPDQLKVKVPHRSRSPVIKIISQDRRHIQFYCEAVNLDRVHNREFRWRISSSQFSNWQESSGAPISVAGLTPGKKELQVQVRYNGENWSPIKNLLIALEGPWWTKAWIRILLPSVVVGAMCLLGYVVVRRSEKKFQHEEAVLKRRNKVLRLEQEALRGQMNPHFIFNALQSIESKVVLNSRGEAREALQSFAKLLRDYLNQSREDLRSLSQEIGLVRAYLTWEQALREGAFTFEIQLPSNIELDKVFIPSMLLQPIVENCIKHGLPRSNEQGKISVKVEMKGRFIKCVIADNGPGYDGKARNDSSGLAVTERRLHLYGEGRKNTFTIRSRSVSDDIVQGTEVIMYIPISSDD